MRYHRFRSPSSPLPQSAHGWELTTNERASLKHRFENHFKMKCSSLLDNLKEALAQVPINPQDVTLLQTTLPPSVDACSSSLLKGHILAIGRSDNCVTVMDSWNGKTVDLRGHSGIGSTTANCHFSNIFFIRKSQFSFLNTAYF